MRFSCRARSTLACAAGDMSPISSMKSVPPSACSNLPLRCLTAEVKAPRSWPADVFDLGRVADDVFRFGGMGAAAAAHRGICRGCGRLRVGSRERLPDGFQQVVHVDGFGEVIPGAVPYGPHRRVDRRFGRKGDERDSGVGDRAGRVGEDHVEGDLRAEFRRRAGILGGLGREPLVFETFAQDVSHAF